MTDTDMLTMGIIGFIVLISCGYGIYYILAELIIGGIATSSWIAVVGGGILAYLLLGLLVAGAVLGGFLLFIAIAITTE